MLMDYNLWIAMEMTHSVPTSALKIMEPSKLIGPYVELYCNEIYNFMNDVISVLHFYSIKKINRQGSTTTSRTTEKYDGGATLLPSIEICPFPSIKVFEAKKKKFGGHCFHFTIKHAHHSCCQN